MCYIITDNYLSTNYFGSNLMERGKRIELSALAWKAKVLPLYEPRIYSGATGQI